MFFSQNISDVAVDVNDQQKDNNDVIIDIDDDHKSNVSLEKEKDANLDEIASAHSGSVVNVDNNVEIMDVDDNNNNEDVESLHVGDIDDNQSNNGSVATMSLNDADEKENELTPPPPPPPVRNGGLSHVDNVDESGGDELISRKNKKKKKKGKRNKKFAMDKEIEFDRRALRESNMDNANFIHPAVRDSIHIWREFPLSTLEFNELLFQPISKENYGRFSSDICKTFESLNKEQKRRNKNIDIAQDDEMNVDELGDINILRESDDVEQGRDDNLDNDLNQDLQIPAHDFSFDGNQNEQQEENENGPDESLAESSLNLEFNIDDQSTIYSVINDGINPPNDPLFDENNQNINIDVIDDQNDKNDDDEDDDIDVINADINHLSFSSNDGNILTQQSSDIINNGIKPRDWSKRAKKTFLFFKGQSGNKFSFDKLMESNKKKEVAAGVFYELLVLKNSDLIDLHQDKPYDDITITKTDQFYRHARLSQKLSQRLSQINEQ